MSLRKSPLSLDSSESDSEELPTFAFLKKEPTSAKRKQPARPNEIIVVDASDPEASQPLSPEPGEPPALHAAVTPTQAEPLQVLSSESEDGEELAPLARRLKCKFLTNRQWSSKDSSPAGERLESHQNEGPSREWGKPSFAEASGAPLGDTAKLTAADNQAQSLDLPGCDPPAPQPACLLQGNHLAGTKTKSGVAAPSEKRAKHSQKRERRGSKGGSKGLRPQGRASWKEGSPRQQDRKKEAPSCRLKAQRPEECLKHMVVVLDPELLQTEGGGQLLGALQTMECWARGVKVDRAGRGFALVWRRQIQQLNRVSLDMASAIVDAYPSPQLLLQAYRQCHSDQECQNLLANIHVRRGVGVTATSRRVGPELSRRVYLQMTALQPDLSLDGAD